MSVTKSQLETDAETIRDETVDGANTATRVGGWLRNLMTWVTDIRVTSVGADDYVDQAGTGAASFSNGLTSTSGNFSNGLTSTSTLTGARIQASGEGNITPSNRGARILSSETTYTVGTSATTILTDCGSGAAFVLVRNYSTNDRFLDLVLASTVSAPVVIQSYNWFGSPPARTYTRNGAALEVALASGSLDINALYFG